MIGIRLWLIRHTKSATLVLNIIPQKFVLFVHRDRGTGGSFDFTGRQNMIEMGMGVNNVSDHQIQPGYFAEDKLRIAPRVNDDTLSGKGVSDNAAIAAQRPHWKS